VRYYSSEHWEPAPCLLKSAIQVLHFRLFASALVLAGGVFCWLPVGAESEPADVRKAWNLLYESQKEKSAAMAVAHLKNNPKSAVWHEILALSKPRTEYQHAATALSLEPLNAHVMATCALLKCQSNAPAAGFALARKAFTLDPKQGRTAAILGLCHSLFGDERGAQSSILQALQLSPFDHDVNLLAATFFVQQSDDERAEKSFKILAERYPHSAEFLILRGKFKRSQSDLEGALKDFDLSIKLEPRNIAALAVRSKTLNQMGRKDEAASGFEKWTQVQSDSARAQMHLAKTCQSKNQLIKAIAAFDRAIELANRPASKEVFCLGQTQLGLKEYELCWFRRMDLCDKSGQTDQALKQANAALEANSDCSGALEIRQNILRKKGRYEEAIVDLTKLINLDNDVSDWYKNRADAYAKLHRAKEAAADLARADHIDTFGK